MALLIAHANVLGYRPGETFDVDLTDPAEAKIVKPYLAGRYISVLGVVTEEPLTAEEVYAQLGEPTSGEDGSIDLSGYRTIGDLRAFADERGIDLHGARTRATVEARITAALDELAS